MPVVSNTSPILNLALIDRLVLLSDLFGEIWVPPSVLKELRTEEDLPGSKSVLGAKEAGWLQVKEVKDQSLVQVLRRELDEGEAEAIALALQVKAEWTFLDERDARRVAKQMGLRITGVLGILLRARREGKLPSLQAAMEQLREKAGFQENSLLIL
jgi:predicted nucleic acid-binding protein